MSGVPFPQPLSKSLLTGTAAAHGWLLTGVWGQRALLVGMPKESGAPRKRKGAAKGAEDGNRREGGGEKEVVKGGERSGQ